MARIVVGALLLLLAVLVPSDAWVAMLRTTPPPDTSDLSAGAGLLRGALAGLGLFSLVGWKLRLWRSEAVAEERRPAPLWEPWLGVLLLVAGLLRIYALGEGLWLDEILALVEYVRPPLGEVVSTFQSQNQHFLFSIAAHASIGIFGDSTWALRLPAAAFGVGSIWALYVFARYVSTRREALLSAAVLTVSYHHVWFSQNARGYTAVLFFSLVASWLCLRALKERRPALWGWYAAAVALGMYSHLTMGFVVLAHFTLYCAALVLRRDEGWPRRWSPFVCGFLFSGLLTFALYAIVVPQFLGSAMGEPSTVPAWRSPLWMLTELLAAADVGWGKAVAGVAGIVVVGLGSAGYWRTGRAVVGLLFLPTVYATVVFMAAGHHLWPRTYFIVAGFGVLVCVRGVMTAAGLVARAARWSPAGAARLGTVALVLAACVSASTLPAVYRPKQDYGAALAFVRDAAQTGDAIVAVGLARFPYEQLYAPDWETAADAAELEAVRSRAPRTWVVAAFPTHLASVHGDIVELLERDFEVVGRFHGSLNGGAIVVHRAGGD